MFAYQVTASPGEVTYSYHAKAGAPFSRLVVTEDGAIQRLVWDPSSGSWKTFYSTPRDTCDAYARCGPFGLCNVKGLHQGVRPCVHVGVAHEGGLRRVPAERAAGLRQWDDDDGRENSAFVLH